MTRHPLAALKSTQLKHLAFLTGLNSTGTKAQLVATLSRELPVSRIAAHDLVSDSDGGHNRGRLSSAMKSEENGRNGTARILSIDMGIRNLAYCVLDMPHGTGFMRRCGRYELDAGSSRSTSSDASVLLSHLRLSAWNRIVVNEVSTSTTLPAASSLPITKSNEIVTSADLTISPLTTPAPPASTIAFEPATYAKLAYNLITSLLITHNPTTILIERQRWRSGGAATVLEWTIRVNMFEGMLHAVLETLRGKALVEGEGKGRKGGGSFPDVYGVSPKRVFDFWAEQSREEDVDGDGGGGVNRVSERGKSADAPALQDQVTVTAKKKKEEKKVVSGSKTKAQKALKIDIVQNWLRPSPTTSISQLPCADDIIDIRNAFLDKLAKQKGRASEGRAVDAGRATKKKVVSSSLSEEKFHSPVTAVVDKLDDLADCLLQGVTWVQWEANRFAVVDGVDLRLLPPTTTVARKPAFVKSSKMKQGKANIADQKHEDCEQ